MYQSVMKFAVIVCLLVNTPFGSTDPHNQCHVEEERGNRLDPFHEILKGANVSVLSTQKLGNFIDKLFDNLKCDGHEDDDKNESHQECEESLCINATSLVRLVGVTSLSGLTEDEFSNASLVLLYLITELDNYCHENVEISTLSVDKAKSALLNITHGAASDHEHIHSSGMGRLLDSLKGFIDHEGHHHEVHDEEGQHEEHEKDDHHIEGQDKEHNEDDQDHHQEHEEEDDHHEEGEAEDHDDDDEHSHMSIITNLVVKAKCLAPESVLYYMNADVSDFIDSERVGDMASVIVHLLSQGSDVDDKCRIMPAKSGFINLLYSQYAGGSDSMSSEGMEKLMIKLKINPGNTDHNEDSHDGHDHRRKRSANVKLTQDDGSYFTSHRSKRQATSVSSSFTQCYTAQQLMSLYDASSSVDKTTFQQLCPSLLSQSLFGECGATEEEEDGISGAEKYGYSSLAVFIICLCSIAGVALIPCTSSKIYTRIMATFLGLAVGTLFSDAILHLIPRVFGVHGHEDGHDHGSEIVLEEFARFGLVIIAALYFFYIIEITMSCFGGHSHDLEAVSNNKNNDHSHEFSNGIKMTTNHTDEENGKNYAGHDMNTKSQKSQLDSSISSWFSMSPVAFMIVLGDAIHNCADGLVIGASFSGGVSTGIATSIAVFCHELPHELGDFAVLLQSGCSFTKAIVLNLLSSLTAFIGLYIGLSLSSNSMTERWIFSVASGMFIYISLVDLLPQLVKGKGSCIIFHNIGMLIGIAIMIILVVFEEHINFD